MRVQWWLPKAEKELRKEHIQKTEEEFRLIFVIKYLTETTEKGFIS